MGSALTLGVVEVLLAAAGASVRGMPHAVLLYPAALEDPAACHILLAAGADPNDGLKYRHQGTTLEKAVTPRGSRRPASACYGGKPRRQAVGGWWPTVQSRSPTPPSR